MQWMNRSGLSKILPELLETRVYVGVSAGSVVTGKDLLLRTSKIIYGEDLNEPENIEGLHCVDFYVLPHLNSECFKNVRADRIQEAAKEIPATIDALNDQSALKVVGGKIEVISEGKYLKFN